MERLFDDPDFEAPATAPTPLAAGPGAPLAARMRPRTLEEFVGQDHLVGPGTPLRALLLAGDLTSTILWGPPGSGKTSLAAVIAATTDAAWAELSAVSAGVKDVRAVIEAGRARLGTGRRTVLFIDEIHRFNKAQQDALLPAVENGWVVLIGATTENPFFEVTAPLLSRCQLARLQPLDDGAVSRIVRRALTDPERGYGGRVDLPADAERLLVVAADGDARVALATLETAVEAARASAGADGDIAPSRADIEAALASKRLRYDRDGDQHYDLVSAFIKSLRGSDPDAAVYWLVRMLAAGEDPRFLARRMIILASEDVGLADRLALPVAVAAFEALDRVGLPEARLNLAHAAIALATAPKSNSVVRALAAADTAVAETGNAPVPAHLRDAHYRAARRLGHGVGYQYAHDHPGGFVPQQHLPDLLAGRRLYDPTDHGDEADVARRLAGWRARNQAATESDGGGRGGPGQDLEPDGVGSRAAGQDAEAAT